MQILQIMSTIDEFQTLKGSLQTKVKLIAYDLVRSVSNPQRIATNAENTVEKPLQQWSFKPSKDRYKLFVLPFLHPFRSNRFKPSKDRYKLSHFLLNKKA